MKMMLFMFVFIFVLSSVWANTMDRQTIENVLNAVSPSCKEEMEIALTSPSEISERFECSTARHLFGN